MNTPSSSSSSIPSPNSTASLHVPTSSSSAEISVQPSNNSGANVSQSTASANSAPASRERIAGWIAELLSSSTRETALMELSHKREKVADLAVLLWHSFGSVAVLLYEVM